MEREKATQDLLEAAKGRSLEAVQAAIEAGADIHHDHDAAFRFAARHDRIEAMEFFLERGADIHALDDDALRSAARENNVRALRFLLENGANPDANDGEALIQSVGHGRFSVFETLLRSGADPNCKDGEAMKIAGFVQHMTMLQMLLNFGGDPFAENGAASLTWAENRCDIEHALAPIMHEQRERFLEDLALAPGTLSFLRCAYGQRQEPGLVRGVKMNCLNAAVARIRETRGNLTFSDLFELKDRTGRTVAELAASRGHLEMIFDADLWRGDPEGLLKSWETLPRHLKDKGGLPDNRFQSVLALCRLEVIKKKAPKFRLKM